MDAPAGEADSARIPEHLQEESNESGDGYQAIYRGDSMKKKNNRRSGQLFSPESGEIARRLRDKEPELVEIIKPFRDGPQEHEAELLLTEEKIANDAKDKSRKD
jgi:hypothetical protein